MESKKYESNDNKLIESQITKEITNTQITTITVSQSYMENILDRLKECNHTDTIIFEDGSILNMPNDYPAMNHKYIPLSLRDNIPQGEEASRLRIRKVNSNISICSPLNIASSIYVTRYGIPAKYSYEYDRFDEHEDMFKFDLMKYSKCYTEDKECSGKVNKYITADYDGYLFSCEKHLPGLQILSAINIADVSSLFLCCSNEVIMYVAQQTNNIKKINFLKKVNLIFELAKKGRINKIQLDPEFEFYGMHFYKHKKPNDIKEGLAFLFTNHKNKIAHIFLDELTDDLMVKNGIALFASKIIESKQKYDLDKIKTYLANKKKGSINNIIKLFKNKYILDVRTIVMHDLSVY